MQIANFALVISSSPAHQHTRSPTQPIKSMHHSYDSLEGYWEGMHINKVPLKDAVLIGLPCA